MPRSIADSAGNLLFLGFSAVLQLTTPIANKEPASSTIIPPSVSKSSLDQQSRSTSTQKMVDRSAMSVAQPKFSRLGDRPSPMGLQSPAPQKSIRDVRILVAEAQTISIGGTNSVLIRDTSGRGIAKLQPNQAYWVSQNTGGIQIGNGQLTNDLWLESDGPIWVNDRAYHGRVRLINNGDGLLAINTLDLETYLTSVVGAEMPSSWHTEALKAQAIAARSYAVALMQQPPSDWYDLGNDERFQVYRGLESVTPETIAAVELTQHQVLVQDGKVLMSEYASTEEVTQEAHAGQGMSQATAQQLANMGYSHLHLLGNFYRGAGLARLL